jgi:hypothetical protein
LREHHAFNVCVLGDGEKHRARTTVFGDHNRLRSEGNSLTILLKFALTSRRLSIFTA